MKTAMMLMSVVCFVLMNVVHRESGLCLVHTMLGTCIIAEAVSNENAGDPARGDLDFEVEIDLKDECVDCKKDKDSKVMGGAGATASPTSKDLSKQVKGKSEDSDPKYSDKWLKDHKVQSALLNEMDKIREKMHEKKYQICVINEYPGSIYLYWDSSLRPPHYIAEIKSGEQGFVFTFPNHVFIVTDKPLEKDQIPALPQEDSSSSIINSNNNGLIVWFQATPVMPRVKIQSDKTIKFDYSDIEHDVWLPPLKDGLVDSGKGLSSRFLLDKAGKNHLVSALTGTLTNTIAYAPEKNLTTEANYEDLLNKLPPNEKSKLSYFAIVIKNISKEPITVSCAKSIDENISQEDSKASVLSPCIVIQAGMDARDISKSGTKYSINVLKVKDYKSFEFETKHGVGEYIFTGEEIILTGDRSYQGKLHEKSDINRLTYFEQHNREWHGLYPYQSQLQQFQVLHKPHSWECRFVGQNIVSETKYAPSNALNNVIPKTLPIPIECLSTHPKVHHIKRFITERESNHIKSLIDQSHGKFRFRMDCTTSVLQHQREMCRSNVAYIPRSKDPVIDHLYKRAYSIANITDPIKNAIPVSSSYPEALNGRNALVVQVSKKEIYSMHHSWLNNLGSNSNVPMKVPLAEIIVALHSDIEVNGVKQRGEIHYPLSQSDPSQVEGLRIDPGDGGAVLQYNILSDSNIDDIALHTLSAPKTLGDNEKIYFVIFRIYTD